MTSTPVGARTAVVVFMPWRPDGTLGGVTATSTVSGSCWTGSIDAAGRSDAWRCSVGNEIHDPCIANHSAAAATEVACPVDDVDHVIVVRLTEHLDPTTANKDGGRSSPWALRIAGSTCWFIDGATDAVAGRRVSYACTDKSSLYGDPDRSAAVWTIFHGPSESADQHQVPILQAWT